MLSAKDENVVSAQRKKINELHARLLEDEATEPQKAQLSKLMKETEILERQNEFLKIQNCNKIFK